jgi:hypothetical protein
MEVQESPRTARCMRCREMIQTKSIRIVIGVSKSSRKYHLNCWDDFDETICPEKCNGFTNLSAENQSIFRAYTLKLSPEVDPTPKKTEINQMEKKKKRAPKEDSESYSEEEQPKKRKKKIKKSQVKYSLFLR